MGSAWRRNSVLFEMEEALIWQGGGSKGGLIAEKGMGRGHQGGWELEQRAGQQPPRNPSALHLEMRWGSLGLEPRGVWTGSLHVTQWLAQGCR